MISQEIVTSEELAQSEEQKATDDPQELEPADV